ncbi:MAG: DUF6804 family protein [Candidatus Sulfotelmatobacter sp.]
MEQIVAVIQPDELTWRINELRRKLAEILSSQERALLMTELRLLEERLTLTGEAQNAQWCTRGLVEFLPDGKAVLNLPRTANIADYWHAFAHLTRRNLGGADVTTLERWLGIEDGAWRPDSEERLACAFERFWWDGDFDGDEGQRKIVERMRSIYPSLVGTPIDVAFPPTVRMVFRRWLRKLPSPDLTQSISLVPDFAPVQIDPPPPTALQKVQPARDQGSLPWQLTALCTIAVLFGLLKLPYGFYVLLRSVICFAAAVGFGRAYSVRSQHWLWIYGAIALFYNPIFPVRLGTRAPWEFLNFMTLALFWVGVWLPRIPSALQHRRTTPKAGA